MLRWYYSVDAVTVLEITDRVRLPLAPDGEGIGVGSHAEAGSGWQGEINVDDPDGDLLMLCHRRIYCVQDEAPTDHQVVGNWFIQDLDVVRMDPFAGAARTWIVQMADENSLLSRRIFVGGDSIRPAETDIERIQWALTTTELNTLDPDEDFIDTAGPVDLDEADLTGQTPEQMLAHCMEHSGKNYWVMYREDLTPNVYVLAYFNPNTSELYPSTRSLSNVAAEIVGDPDVSAIGDDTRLNRAGGRIASGGYGPYDRQDAGPPYVYEQITTTGDTYVYRDVAMPARNDKTEAAASARVLRELAELDEPDDEVTTTIRVNEEQVNEVMHGMSIPLHATHLPNFTEDSGRPGYAAGTGMRVMRRTVRQVAPTMFDLGLVLSPMGGFGCVQSVLSAFSLGGSVEVDFPNPIAEGSLIWYWTTGASDADPVSGYTETTVYVRNNDMLNFSIGRFGYKVAGASESQHLQIDNYAGGARPVLYACELVGVSAPTDIATTGATSETGGPNEGEPWVTDPYPTNPVTATGPGYVIGGFVYWYPSGSSECPPSSGNGPWTVHMTNFLPTGTVVDAEEPFDSNGAIGSQFSMTSLAHVEVESAGAVTLTGDGCSGYYAQDVYTGAVLAYFPLL